MKPIHIKVGILAFSFLFVVWALSSSDSIGVYINSIKSKSMPVIENKQDDLYLQITSLAKKMDEPPIDSRVDPIWKAIPGYNGVKVNIPISYAVAEQFGYVSEEMLVTDELPIKVTLDDLGAVPIYRANPNKPMVSLMINVAWGTEYLPSMLETLKKEKVRATFFLDGSWLNKNPEMARKIVREGHEIGNHGYSHPLMSKISAGRMREEIQRTEDAIKHNLGISSALFTPPAGDYNQVTVNIADSIGLKTVLWTLDTVDWRKPAPRAIIQRIVPKVGKGMLILMHPTDPTQKALPTLIQEIKRKGLRFGTVSENLLPTRVP